MLWDVRFDMLRGLLKHTVGRRSGLYELLNRSPRKAASSHHLRSGAKTGKGAGKLTDELLACRYEFKYRISESKAAAIEQFIKPYLYLDHYCKLQPSSTYPIVTLYLDSQGLRLCRQTLEGNKNRFKLRIRSYTDELNYPRL